MKRRWEALDLRDSYRAMPAFGLHIHFLESESVEQDDAVDSAIARSAHAHHIAATPPVAHGMKQVQNQMLKEFGGRASDVLAGLNRRPHVARRRWRRFAP